MKNKKLTHRNVKFIHSSFFCFFLDCEECEDMDCETKYPKLFDDRDLLNEKAWNDCIDEILDRGYNRVFTFKRSLIDRIRGRKE